MEYSYLTYLIKHGGDGGLNFNSCTAYMDKSYRFQKMILLKKVLRKGQK